MYFHPFYLFFSMGNFSLKWGLTRIIVDIEIGGDLNNVPGARLPVVGEVDMVLVVEKTQWNLGSKVSGDIFKCWPLPKIAQILASLSSSSSQLHRYHQTHQHHHHQNHHHHHHHYHHQNLIPSECPGAKLHNASLLVKREVRHVDCTGRLKIFLLSSWPWLLLFGF